MKTATSQQTSWQNWSGGQRSTPERIIYPKDVDALINEVKAASKCRVVGAGHSFTPLAKTDDTLFCLDNLSGLISHDAEKCQATVYAGTRLKNMGQALADINQSLFNQGDIDEQSIAGAVGTGTHGTGKTLECISNAAVEFELVCANGDVLTCNAQENADIFHAGRVSLGSLGIMSKITLQNLPLYKLEEKTTLADLDYILENIESLADKYRHVECMPFLHSDKAILKILDSTNKASTPEPSAPLISDDFALTAMCEAVRFAPFTNKSIQKLVKHFLSDEYHINYAYKIFPTPRNTRFNEMEYQVPAVRGVECLQEVMHCLRKHNVPVAFPLEFRYVKGDDAWISPFYQRDSASISMHQYHKCDYASVFKLVEPIFWKYEGRPHWGKLHTLGAQELSELYPKWQDFLAIREQLDPTQKFLNAHLSKLFLNQTAK